MKGRQIEYSPAELRFLESHSALPRKELHAAFVRQFLRSELTVDHIKGVCTRRGWIKTRRWTADEDRTIRELYADTKTQVIADRLGRELQSIYRRAKNLGLAKSQTYLASPAACRLRRGDRVGAAYRYPKGHAPANKGLRRPGFAPGRMSTTQFKKGVATNWSPVGTEKIHVSPINKNRPKENSYWYRKIADVRNVPWTKNWKALHIIKWEELHGPMPRAHALKCLDGDQLNTDPSNWELIPRSVLLQLNRKFAGAFDQAPPELKSAMIAIAKVTLATSAAKRRQGAAA